MSGSLHGFHHTHVGTFCCSQQVLWWHCLNQPHVKYNSGPKTLSEQTGKKWSCCRQITWVEIVFIKVNTIQGAVPGTDEPSYSAALSVRLFLQLTHPQPSCSSWVIESDEEPALLFYFLLFIAENGHTQPATLTTNCQMPSLLSIDAHSGSLPLSSAFLLSFTSSLLDFPALFLISMSTPLSFLFSLIFCLLAKNGLVLIRNSTR